MQGTVPFSPTKPEAVNICMTSDDLSQDKDDNNTEATEQMSKAHGGKSTHSNRRQCKKKTNQTSPQQKNLPQQHQNTPCMPFDLDLAKVLNPTIASVDTSAPRQDKINNGLELAGVRTWNDFLFLNPVKLENLKK